MSGGARSSIRVQVGMERERRAELRRLLRGVLGSGAEAWSVALRPTLVYEVPEAGEWWWAVVLRAPSGANQVLLVRPDAQTPATLAELVGKAVRGRLLTAVCSGCKRMRVKEGAWLQRALPENLLHVTHGICPECAARLYPELTERLRRGRAMGRKAG